MIDFLIGLCLTFLLLRVAERLPVRATVPARVKNSWSTQ